MITSLVNVAHVGPYFVQRVNTTTPSKSQYNWTITFGCPSQSGFPVLVPENINLGPSLQLPATSYFSTSRVLGSAPVGGSFALSIDGTHFTAPLSYASSTSQIQAGLQALPPVNSVSVVVSQSGSAL